MSSSLLKWFDFIFPQPRSQFHLIAMQIHGGLQRCGTDTKLQQSQCASFLRFRLRRRDIRLFSLQLCIIISSLCRVLLQSIMTYLVIFATVTLCRFRSLCFFSASPNQPFFRWKEVAWRAVGMFEWWELVLHSSIHYPSACLFVRSTVLPLSSFP